MRVLTGSLRYTTIMARTGIQPGSLILPSADYLVRRFRQDPTITVPYGDIIAELTRLDAQDPSRTPGTYIRESIKSAVRRHVGTNLVFVKEGIKLHPEWDADAFAESVKILHGGAEGSSSTQRSDRR